MKVFHQLTTLNVILNHVLVGVIGLHGPNVLMHVAKMSAPEKEKISANTFPLQRAKAFVKNMIKYHLMSLFMSHTVWLMHYYSEFISHSM